MDFLAVLAFTLALSIYNLNRHGSYEEHDTTIIINDATNRRAPSTIPVGNNLMLIHEPDAFEEILKELGLAGK